MGFMMGILLLFIGAITALIFSILSWRTKENSYFIIGSIASGLILIYLIWNYKYVISLFSNPESSLFGVITISFFIVPVIFLISTKRKGSNGDSEITDTYLDDIIESEDEEIDFE